MEEVSKEDSPIINPNNITIQMKKHVKGNKSSIITKSQIVDSNLNNETINTNSSNDNNSSEKSPQKQAEKSEKVELKPSAALDEYKKMCSKSYGTPNLNIISQLKQEALNIYSNYLNQKEIISLSKIISKYIYFKSINFGPFDSVKGNIQNQNKKTTESTPATKSKSTLKKNPKKNKYIIPLQLVQAIGKNLIISDRLISLKITNFIFQADLIPQLNKGLLQNKSLQELSIIKCVIPLDAYELLLGGLLKHEKIEKINLSKNKLNDKYGTMISRVISRQNERRDEIVWGYGLRNEVPKTNEYARGLISLDLSYNEFSNISAESISNCLVIDQYIRYIDLSNNKLNYHSMKCFYKMLKTNKTLLTINLKGNPGYNDKIHEHMVMKMCKNIKYLYELYLNKKYTMEDFEYYKGFIDKKLFTFGYDEFNNEYNTSVGFNNSKMSGRMMRLDTGTNNIDNMNESGYRRSSICRSKASPNKTNRSLIKNHNNINSTSICKTTSPFESPLKKSKIYDSKYEDLEVRNMKLTSENINLRKKLAEIKAKCLEKSIENKISESSNSESLVVPKENCKKILNLLGEVDDLVKNTERKIESKEKNKNDFQSKTYYKKKSTIKSNDKINYFKTMNDDVNNKKYQEIKKIIDNVELKENQNKKKKREMINRINNKEYNNSDDDDNKNIKRYSSNESDKRNEDYEYKNINNKEKNTNKIKNLKKVKNTDDKVEEEKNDQEVYKKEKKSSYKGNTKKKNKEKKDNIGVKNNKNKNNILKNKEIDNKEKNEKDEKVAIKNSNIEHPDKEYEKPSGKNNSKNKDKDNKINIENIDKKKLENSLKVKNVDDLEDDKKQIFNFEDLDEGLDAEPSEDINDSDEIQRNAVNQLFNNHDEDNYDDYSENGANEYQYSHEQNDKNGDNCSENEGSYELDDNIIHKSY